VAVYYEERGWSAQGIPKVETLQKLGLWEYLDGETRNRIAGLA